MTTPDDVRVAIADALASATGELNRLDATAGDGDLGVTAGLIAGALRDLAVDQPDAPFSEQLRAAGRAIARQAPSSFGTLLAMALRRAASGLDESDQPVEGSTSDADGRTGRFAIALEHARDEVAERGRVRAGDKTMLDAIAPAASAARSAAGTSASFAHALDLAARAARDGAEATASMEATVGRAGWLAARAAGHIDPGAHLVALMLEAAAEHFRRSS